MMKALQAPKKRDEMFECEASSRKAARAQEYENMSIRAFRLEGSSCKSGSSTGDSSKGNDDDQ